MWLSLRVIILALLIAGIAGPVALCLSGEKIVSVQTASMKPTFGPGDALLVSPALAVNLKLGEIVSYHNPRNPNLTISHRLTSVNSKTGWLTTTGDGLGQPDPSFPPNLLIGKATVLLPRLGKTLDWLHKPMGLSLAIYIPAAAIITTETLSLSRAYTRPLYSARL